MFLVSVLVLKSHVSVCLYPILLPHWQVSPFLALDRLRQHICCVTVQRYPPPVPAGLSLSSVRPPGGAHLWDCRSAGRARVIVSRGHVCLGEIAGSSAGLAEK